ncbi:MAG TPA: CCA tRNA nucleotidyltransferase [Candidatus Sulfotelmatobacter sp.]|nr:CCA tRNA nucleotidyltransferase [Candidatus Sulfotelmatobacter sp.]
MADYIYTMEIRLTPDQLKGVNLVQEITRAAGMNLYLTGGAIRDIISGFTIRDLDFTVQGNPLKLQKDFEKAGAQISALDEDMRTLFLLLPGRVRAEISMARTEKFEKTGKPPIVTPATIHEDLRRRDFTVNAMALSLNEGSRGLLLDPFNGVADIEAKLIRILHNYSFLEDPSRLIRATRFATRFHWPIEERTQARYDAAKEGNYIEHILRSSIGHEIAALAHEDDPLNVVKALEKEGWLQVLHPHWTSAKADTVGLGALMKTRQQMVDLGYAPDAGPAVMYFLTARLSEKDIADLRKLIPRKDLIEAWRDIEDHAKELAKRLMGKEAATPSRTWQLLSDARPEMILFLAVTARQQTVEQKIKNFLTKWRQIQQKVPLPEMTELLITPQLPEYPKIAREVFMLLLDGKLRSHTEILKFLKPYAPPPPPPPPAPRRGRAKAIAVGDSAAAAAGKKGEAPKAKGKGAAVAASAAAPAATKSAVPSPKAASPASKPSVLPSKPVVKKAEPAKPAKPQKPAKLAKPAKKKTAKKEKKQSGTKKGKTKKH